MLRRIGGGQRHQAPIRTVRLVVAVDGLPQGGERHEYSLAPLRFFNLLQEVEHRLASDFATLEVDIVGALLKADQQCRSQRSVILVLAAGVLALSLRTKGRRDGLRERRTLRTHSGTCFSVTRRKIMTWQFCQAGGKFLPLLAIHLDPGGAVPASIAGK